MAADETGTSNKHVVELIRAIDEIRGELAEARRYIRSSPSDAREIISRTENKLRSLGPTFGNFPTATKRTATNLNRGCDGILACPVALEGAIDLASFELAWARGKLERNPSLLEYSFVEYQES